MATIKVKALLAGNIIENDTVVWGDKGQPFGFKVSNDGSVETQIGDMSTEDLDRLKGLIETKTGTVTQNNPDFATAQVVTKVTGGGWVKLGKLYKVM